MSIHGRTDKKRNDQKLEHMNTLLRHPTSAICRLTSALSLFLTSAIWPLPSLFPSSAFSSLFPAPTRSSPS